MASQRYKNLYAQIETSLREKPKRTQLYNAVKRARDARRTAIDILPQGEAFRKEVRDIKVRCLHNLDDLVDQFAAKVESRGAKVFLAKDGAAAIDYILKLSAEKNAETVAKSKSLTSEEIEVNHPMEDAGLEVIETDLGELIIQKVHEKPFHLVFPAVHKTAVEVAEIFKKETGEDVPNDVDAIMKIVRQIPATDFSQRRHRHDRRERGRRRIRHNPDRNQRRQCPSRIEHPRCTHLHYGTRKSSGNSRRRIANDAGASRQRSRPTHDNLCNLDEWQIAPGRGRGTRAARIAYHHPGQWPNQNARRPLFSDALNCIRCGACMNICPTYGVVGGHAFGYIYPGPIGIPWTAEVHGVDKAGDFAPLCISCGLCKEICPAEIDIPMMIAGVKDRDSEANPHPRVNKMLMAAEKAAKMSSLTAPISNWMMDNGLVRWAMEK